MTQTTIKSLELIPMLEHGLAETAELLNRGFSDYFVRVVLNQAAMLHMIAHDSVDVSSSRIALRDGEPAGAALIARRGWSSRLAGMAIVPEARGAGVGQWLMEGLVAEARGRGERRMELEVIEQNIPAVRLYESCGFQAQRRLVGYGATDLDADHRVELEKVDIRDVARMVTTCGLPDLPWQLSGESLALVSPPSRAYRLGAAYAVISDPRRGQIAIRSLLVEPGVRHQGQAIRLLQALIASYPRKTWRIPPLCPEEIGGLFEKAGFTRNSLTQIQMELDLTS